MVLVQFSGPQMSGRGPKRKTGVIARVEGTLTLQSGMFFISNYVIPILQHASRLCQHLQESTSEGRRYTKYAPASQPDDSPDKEYRYPTGWISNHSTGDANMTKLQHRLTKAIYTANSWSSDQHGLALLSLGTTRHIHSEDHRRKALAEVDGNVAWNRAWTGTPDEVNDPARDIPALEDLRRFVVDAVIGIQWLTDAEDMRFNEELHQAGELN